MLSQRLLKVEVFLEGRVRDRDVTTDVLSDTMLLLSKLEEKAQTKEPRQL